MQYKYDEYSENRLYTTKVKEKGLVKTEPLLKCKKAFIKSYITKKLSENRYVKENLQKLKSDIGT